jgi:hypothetical protein
MAALRPRYRPRDFRISGTKMGSVSRPRLVRSILANFKYGYIPRWKINHLEALHIMGIDIIDCMIITKALDINQIYANIYI